MDMRYRRVYVNRESDGSVSVWSHGPVIGVLRIVFGVWLVMIAAAGLLALFTGNFAAFGALLLLFAICMPNYAKRRRLEAKAAGKSEPPT
jgi:hypothetical protein